MGGILVKGGNSEFTHYYLHGTTPQRQHEEQNRNQQLQDRSGEPWVITYAILHCNVLIMGHGAVLIDVSRNDMPVVTAAR